MSPSAAPAPANAYASLTPRALRPLRLPLQRAASRVILATTIPLPEQATSPLPHRSATTRPHAQRVPSTLLRSGALLDLSWSPQLVIPSQQVKYSVRLFRHPAQWGINSFHDSQLPAR